MPFCNLNIFLILAMLVAPAWAAADGAAPKPGKNGQPKEPMEVTARDSFSWDQNTQSYVAVGDVHVTQGDSQLFADQVTAYYEQGDAADGTAPQPKPKPAPAAKGNNDVLGGSANGPGGGQQITLIVATGHVHIIKNGDDLVGDKAVYDKPKSLVTITGEHVVVKSEGKILTGSTKVVYNMDTQQAVAVTTPGTGRLKALLQ